MAIFFSIMVGVDLVVEGDGVAAKDKIRHEFPSIECRPTLSKAMWQMGIRKPTVRC